MRRFIVVGQKAKASGDFLLADIPSTSGRLDVLLRALRASLLVSHGVRRDCTTYLALLGEPERARVIRLSGAAARYLRPDERSLATTIKKALAFPVKGATFSAARPGIDVACGGIEVLGPELTNCQLYLLEASGPDIRSCPQLEPADRDCAFILGDHLGLTPEVRAYFSELGAQPLSVGPTELYTEDAIAVLTNELDRRSTQVTEKLA
ncbi:MAG: hypothetical protein RL701_5045 [Pseudomonadota bacterium]|jgi:tRNA (pseudouridine54-N1)-methyltransferase